MIFIISNGLTTPSILFIKVSFDLIKNLCYEAFSNDFIPIKIPERALPLFSSLIRAQLGSRLVGCSFPHPTPQVMVLLRDVKANEQVLERAARSASTAERIDPTACAHAENDGQATCAKSVSPQTGNGLTLGYYQADRNTDNGP